MAKADSKHKQTKEQLNLAEILHDRAREASSQHRNLLVSLSTGCLAVFFVTLTTKIDPPLTNTQSLTLLISLSAMSLAIIVGLLSWYSDGRRNYFWASGIQSDEGERRKRLFKQRNNWYKMMQLSNIFQRSLFIIGILSASFYLFLRINCI